MNEWFSKLTAAWSGSTPELGPGQFFALLAVSAGAAWVIALLYGRFYSGRSAGSEIHRAFPLLAIAVTTIFICIQFSLPLSLGLLGALSIVRFRTPIKEPEEIGFLMVVLATSLAAATGLLAYLGLVLVAAVVVLAVQSRSRGVLRQRADSGLVVASFDAAAYEQRGKALLAELAAAGRRGALESLTCQDGRVTVTWRFHGLSGAEAPDLERRVRERAAPDALAIVYATESSLA